MRRTVPWLMVGGFALLLGWSLLAWSRPGGVAERAPLVAPVTNTSTTVEPAIPAEAVDDVAPAPAADVPVRSGAFDTQAVPVRRTPVALAIDSLGVEAAVVPVGYDTEREEMEIPRRADLVGWYEFSAEPGSTGSAVLAAHVDWNGRAGVFYDLFRSQPGDRITIDFDDGTRAIFEVIAAAQYDKRALPNDEIFRRDGEPLLTLITCGGVFNEAVRSYDDNIVVYARPLDVEPPADRS